MEMKNSMLHGLKTFYNDFRCNLDRYKILNRTMSPNMHNFHIIPTNKLTAISGIVASPGAIMTAAAKTPENESYVRVSIIENCRDDSLIVPECRIRPGYFDPNNRFIDKIYHADNKPNKVYLANNPTKEIDCPIEGSVIVFQGECNIILRSRIVRDQQSENSNKPNKNKTFAILCKYGVVANQPSSILVRQDGADDIVTQVFRVSYTDNAEFGCIVFRCAGENVTYGKDVYRQNELLTIYFHRTREDYEVAPYPPVVTLTHLQEQNYVPMIPGQILQIIPNLGEVEIEDYQTQSDRSMLFVNKEPITKNGKLWVYRYECIRVAETVQLFFLKGEQTCSVIIPPIFVDDKDLFVVISQPYKNTKIVCYNIVSLRFRFVKDIPVVRWPKKMIYIPSVNSCLHELNVRFHKRMDSVNVVNENGTCSISCTLPGFGTYTPPVTKVKNEK